jgi:hypothetical protein
MGRFDREFSMIQLFQGAPALPEIKYVALLLGKYTPVQSTIAKSKAQFL